LIYGLIFEVLKPFFNSKTLASNANDETMDLLLSTPQRN